MSDVQTETEVVEAFAGEESSRSKREQALCSTSPTWTATSTPSPKAVAPMCRS